MSQGSCPALLFAESTETPGARPNTGYGFRGGPGWLLGGFQENGKFPNRENTPRMG